MWLCSQGQGGACRHGEEQAGVQVIRTALQVMFCLVMLVLVTLATMVLFPLMMLSIFDPDAQDDK